MNLWKSIPRNVLLSSIGIGVICLLLIFGLPGVNSSWFQFPKNYEINDNSRNWANHEYGYNLMMSAEPNSIFMTEGGDNQVFSLLYFATAERMRPDIDFFDQKGNVFPRLYGDLLNTHPDEIGLIRNIRDFQLFSTGRPIYLTWEREGLEKLNINFFRQQKNTILNKMPPEQRVYLKNKFRLDTLDQLKSTAHNMVPKSVYDLELRSGGNLSDQDFQYLGPWYFKNMGMVFRVTPIRYAIVDALDALNGRGNFSSINNEVVALSKLSMILQQFQYYVNQLENEGYVRREGDEVIRINSFQGSFDPIYPMEHWNHYQFSYLEIPNAKNWDFLTREIFANTVRMFNLSVGRYEKTLRKQLKLEKDLSKKKTIQTEIKHWQKRLEDIRKTVTVYNYDNPGMTYPHAVETQNNGNMEEAATLFIMTARGNYRFSDNFLRGIQLLLDLAERNEEKKNYYLSLALDYLKEFYQNQDIFSAMTKRAPDENLLNLAQSLEKRIAGINTTSVQQVEDLEKQAGEDINSLRKLSQLYQERGNYNKAIEVMEKILKIEPQQYRNYQNLFDYAKDNRIDIAVKTVDQTVLIYDSLIGDKPPLWEIHYYRGDIFFKYVNALKTKQQANKSQLELLLNDSQKSYNEFLNGYHQSSDSIDNQTRQRANIAEKTLERIKVLLKE